MSEYRKVIAICGTWLYEEKEYAFVTELIRKCKEKGYITVAINLSMDSMNLVNDSISETKLLDLMGYLKCDAVIIMGETIKTERMLDNIIKTVKKMHVPVFAMEKHMEGCINVAMRFGTGFHDIVKHIVEDHGCRKVDMIAGVKDNKFSDDRIAAYKEVLAENNIPFEEKRLFYGEFWDRPTRIVMEKILAEDELPEAIICANDAMAVTVCAVLHERGICVPEDIIVTGFDGINSAKINIPSISTVEPDCRGELEIIFDILERIERGEKPDLTDTRYVDFRVSLRKSCGCGDQNDYLNVNSLSDSLNDQKWHMYSLNKLLLSSIDMNDVKTLQPLLNECVGLWNQQFYFVALYKDFVDGDFDFTQNYLSKQDEDAECYTLFRMKDSKYDFGAMFRESELMPGLTELFREDSGYEMVMFRLLQTNMMAYGYLMEGFRKVDERGMRRCEELGLFLSTALDSLWKNHKMMIMTEQLKEINKEIEIASTRDYLTELYNRRGFYDELYKMIRDPENRDRYLTFFSIDMDGLKIINDTYGHTEGDFALKALASAIRHFVLRNGICSRYGGDEFVCAILTDQETNFTPEIVRERLKTSLYANKELETKKYRVSASVGCRCIRIGEKPNLEELMHNADEDMYQDKQKRRKNRK